MITTLSNGLRVLVESVRRAPVVAFQGWVQVGSGDEVGPEAGLSHMLEHMLFKGTAHGGVGQIARDIEGCGGEINAYTSFDQTVLHLVVPSRFAERGLGVVRDAIFAPALDAEEFEREKLVVLEEIRRGEDDPGHKLSSALFAETYHVHPYGRPVIGTTETVRAFTPRMLREFHHRWYVPGNVTLVVVGDLDEEEMLAAIEGRLGAVAATEPPRRVRPTEPEQTAARCRVLRERVREARVEVAFPLPAVTDERIPATDLLAMIIGQGESSRLNQAVRNRLGLANHVQAVSYTPVDPGVFIVGLSCPPDRLEDALGATVDELRAMVSRGPRPDEVRRAVTNVLSDRTYERETVEGIARKLGYFEALFGDPAAEDRFYAAISRATPGWLMEVAGEVLRPDRATVAALVPEGDATRAEDLLARVQGGLAAASVAIGERADDGPRTERHVLSNGARLLVRENPGSGLVSLRMGMHGGLRFERRRSNGLYNLMARVWPRGTRRRSAVEVAQAIEDIAGRCTAFSGRNSVGLTSTFLASGMDRGLDLFREIAFEPAFDADETDRMRALVLQAIANIPDNPIAEGFLHFHRLMYRAHPFRMPVMGTATSVPRLTPGRLRSAWRRGLRGGNVVLAAVGDFDGGVMAARLTGLLSELPDGSPPAAAPAEEEPIEETRSRTVAVDKEQAHLFIGFPGARVTDPDRHALELLGTVLAGQSGRLFMDLRDRRGLAYSVTAWSQEAVDPGFFATYIGTDPARIDEAREGMLAHLRRLAVEPVPEEELQRAAAYLVGSYEIGMQRGGAVASRLLFDELYGLGHDAMNHYAERVLGQTAADLQRTAAERFTIGRHVELTLMPRR